ncbi:MAG: DUF5675 family protein [Synergistaceae bacterium]
MKLELIRTEDAETHTLGILREYVSNKEICRTIERPWLDNQPGISCIPEATYKVVPDNSGKHQYFKILDVEDRESIEIHVANKAKELNGCIACGDAVLTASDGERMVLHSRKTMDALKAEYPDGFELVIRSV